jgi:hypothetical protein
MSIKRHYNHWRQYQHREALSAFIRAYLWLNCATTRTTPHPALSPSRFADSYAGRGEGEDAFERSPLRAAHCQRAFKLAKTARTE